MGDGRLTIIITTMEDDDYDVYQYSDEDGYSVEEDEDMPDADVVENPNAPPVHYSKVGEYIV